MAESGQNSAHAPHPLHFSPMLHAVSRMVIASSGHTAAHPAHFEHLIGSMTNIVIAILRRGWV